jgi:hypothetical protein
MERYWRRRVYSKLCLLCGTCVLSCELLICSCYVEYLCRCMHLQCCIVCNVSILHVRMFSNFVNVCMYIALAYVCVLS